MKNGGNTWSSKYDYSTHNYRYNAFTIEYQSAVETNLMNNFVILWKENMIKNLLKVTVLYYQYRTNFKNNILSSAHLLVLSIEDRIINKKKER